MRIKAAVLKAPRDELVIESVECDEPRESEILVRLVACGICHSDISCIDGVIPTPYPIVLGHEGAGIIERVGSAVVGFEAGDHVLLSFSSCGSCTNCNSGQSPYCDHFRTLNFGGARRDGSVGLRCEGIPIHNFFFGQSAFATHAVMPAGCAIKVDKSLPLKVLAPLGCGFQTGAGAVFEVLRPEAGDAIAVFGAGAVGLAAVIASRIMGCKTILAIDRLQSRLDLAMELGATHAILAEDPIALPELVRRVCPQGARFSIDATGNPAVAGAAVLSLEKLGTCALLGLFPPGGRLPVDVRQIVVNGLTIRGSVEGDSQPRSMIPRLVDLYEKGMFPIDKLIVEFPLPQINLALKAARVGDIVKPVIVF